MGVRRGVGGAGIATRLRKGVALALALGVMAAIGGDARARVPARPLDFHAILLNGRIVGSTFVIADRLAVTNAHVVRGRAPGDFVTLVVSGPGRREVSARVRAISSRMDLALLDVPSDLLPTVGAGGHAATGQRVVSAGVDAGGPEWPGPPREASGDVTMPADDLPAFGPGLIAHMPGARPGFSGGPLLDGQGRLIGMVTAIRHGTAERPSGEIEAFALRADEIRGEVDRLLAVSRR